MNTVAVNIPRFERVDWALKYAYIAEAMRGSPSMNMKFPGSAEGLDDFQWFMRSITKNMTSQEIITDGIMLKNTIIRHVNNKCGRFGHWIIGAKYRIPNDEFLQYMKQGDYFSLAGEIKILNKNIPDVWFVVDVIRGYMEGTARMHKSYEDWARHLGVSDKTVYRWAGSKEPGHKSIKQYLSAWEHDATIHAIEKLREIGELQ